MDIEIKYNNGLAPFNVSLPVVKGWRTPIIELQIEKKGGSRSRQVAIYDYIIQLQSAFRELIDQSDSTIEDLRITDFYLLKEISKKGKDINFIDLEGSVSDVLKYDISLYYVLEDSFKEYLYFTKDSATKKAEDKTFQNHIINENLITRKKLMDDKFIKTMITIVELHFPDYTIDVDEMHKKLKFLYKGQELKDIDDIKKNDVFVFFKLLEVLYHRGEHYGIYFFNCQNISPAVLKAMVTFLKLYYTGNNLTFLFNVPLESKVGLEKLSREIVVLPNLRLKDNEKK